MRIKKRSTLFAGMVAVAATVGVSSMVGMSEVAPGNGPVATHSQHSSNVPTGVQNGASTDLLTDVAAAPPAPSTAVPADQSTNRPAPGSPAGMPGKEIRVAPLPDVASDVAGTGKDKTQSLREALARPHGVAAAGVSPEGAGVNNGTTKQATGLKLRSLAPGEQDAGVNDAARTGGCAPGYGDGRSCLPVAPPSAAEHAGHNMKVPWTCSELLTLFPKGIPLQIRGVDPLGLDEDGNGIACA